MLIDLNRTKADKLTDDFLKELKKNTPVSGRFLDILRSDVQKLFEDLPENRQCTLMFFLRQLAESNAEARLEYQSFQNAKRGFQYVAGLVASTLIVAHGGFGDKIISEA
jgi:hypothetical protein